MPRGTSKDAAHFREVLEKGVILVGGEAVDNNSIDLNDDTPVAVAIVMDVQGFGPHPGVLAAGQGDHVDAALEVADEILEEWTLNHYPDSDPEHFTETFDGLMWEISPREFVDAIAGTKAAEFFADDIIEEEEEEPALSEARDSGGPPTAKDVLAGLGQYLKHEGHDAARESARIARLIAGVRGDSDKADKVLEEVDKLVNGSGIEAIRDENVNDSYYGDIVALYVNMGDTYETTLLYDVEQLEFFVTSYGDWYEQYEQERDGDGESGDGEEDEFEDDEEEDE